LSTTALLLVILAAVCHATWNLAAKRAAHVGGVFLFWTTLLSSLVFAPWALWIVLQDGFVWSWIMAGAMVASGFLHLAYSHALQSGYRKADLSVVYPIARGTGPLLSSLGAFVLLAEVPGPLRLLGLAGVVGGILLIATDGRLSTFTRPGAMAGLRWGLLTGSLIATYTLVDGAAVKLLLLSPVLLDWGANVVRTLLLTPHVLRDRQGSIAVMQGHWVSAWTVAVLAPFGYILVLLAMQQGAPLSVVAPMREMSMMLVALLGMVLLREPVGRARLAGCALMVAGVVLLARS
jgi:drug/metabolite transporter (DMT)-like permease